MVPASNRPVSFGGLIGMRSSRRLNNCDDSWRTWRLVISQLRRGEVLDADLLALACFEIKARQLLGT
jgi:hypothetical protein